MLCGSWRFNMRWQRYLLLSNVFVISHTVLAEDKLTIEMGNWPEMSSSIIGSTENPRRIVFSSDKIKVYQEDIEHTVIEIEENAIIYAPEGTRVQAQPKTYTHPELSKEVKNYYTYSLGTYAFWAAMIGISAAIR